MSDQLINSDLIFSLLNQLMGAVSSIRGEPDRLVDFYDKKWAPFDELQSRFCKLLQDLIPFENEFERKHEELIKSKNQGYWERNQLVRYLSTIFPSWMELHPKEDLEWDRNWKNIVFIRFPQGKYSWHIHLTEVPFFEHLNFRSGNSWDGSTVEMKYHALRKTSNCPVKVILPPEIPIKSDKPHECCSGDFTCHYLGGHLTLTYQKPGTDSDHVLVKNCPFCSYKEWSC